MKQLDRERRQQQQRARLQRLFGCDYRFFSSDEQFARIASQRLGFEVTAADVRACRKRERETS